jgi:trehalose synthase
MDHLQQVDIAPLAPERFETVLNHERFEEFTAAIVRARETFAGRRIWNINSTAKGGGVAEMLRSLLAYAQGAGVDARWLVIGGDAPFFRVTKRIHNRLHGARGDGGDLGDTERGAYEGALRRSAEELGSLIEPGDVVLLHDPQTAGLIAAAKELATAVIWRCHVGLDRPNDLAREAWRFLIPYVSLADAYVFSREAFEWEGLDDARMTIIPPSIDAFSPKNQDMDRSAVDAILATTGLIQAEATTAARFVRIDGSQGTVERASRYEDGGAPPTDATRLVVQVSRWDRLKDPVGVIQGFVDHVAPDTDAHLIVAGPEVTAVSDDPEGVEVLAEAHEVWSGLPSDLQPRVHLACLPMEDGEENAAMVNALQRRADVIVQKSLAEGFGLTVAEGMWKGRPVVASRIGGIQDQITDGETGLLLDDPTDLAEYGAAVKKLLADTDLATEMGTRAQQRVRDDFLGARHLMQYVDLISKLL